MRRFFWSIPGLTIYVYATNILIQWGLYSYFGIPSEYVSASIISNIIGYYGLFQLAKGVAGLMGWWLLILVASALIVIVFYFFSSTFQKLTTTVVTLFLIWLVLYGCYNFGMWIGKNQTYYYIPTPGCITIGTATGFIIPGFIDDKAILVPINSQHKMIGGYTTRDLSQIPCPLEKREVGKITK